MTRRCTLVLTTLLTLCALITVMAPAKGQPRPVGQNSQAAAQVKTAEEVFKNIQVLKGVPADQLIPTMQFISASLGVECEFCHVKGAFEKDDKKPKQTARKMIEMMFAINADNFDRNREVTCYSCHRGSTSPVGIPPVMGAEARSMSELTHTQAEDKQNAGPTPDQLIEKYVQASGGSAAIEKITSRVMKGKIEFAGMSYSIDIYSKEPDERISFMHMPEGDSVTAFNGHEGWMSMTGRPVHEIRGGELEEAAIDADLHFATHLKQMFSGMEAGGSEKVNDQPAYLFVGQREGKPPILLYFAQQSGLLLRMLRFTETALGRLPTQIDYADYRERDGVKVPYRWTLARPNGEFTVQIGELQQNVAIDDAKFAKPSATEVNPK
jgi:photosynthetic reaction center cytochrome c subunit